MPIQRMIKRAKARAQPKPVGTRCYVPGFLDDQSQFAIDQSQLGIAPLVVASTAAQFIKFKGKTKPGQPLPYGSVTGEPFQVQVTRIPTSVLEQAVALNRNPFNLSKGIAPSGLAAMKAELEKRRGGTTSIQPMPSPALIAIAPPAPQPPGVTPPMVPSIGPITIALPSPAPPGYAMPTPPSMLPGGEPQVPDEVARPQAQQAGLFSGDMAKLIIPGIGLFLLAQVFGKKGR